jgi:hypothetical protein
VSVVIKYENKHAYQRFPEERTFSKAVSVQSGKNEEFTEAEEVLNCFKKCLH